MSHVASMTAIMRSVLKCGGSSIKYLLNTTVIPTNIAPKDESITSLRLKCSGGTSFCTIFRISSSSETTVSKCREMLEVFDFLFFLFFMGCWLVKEGC